MSQPEQTLDNRQKHIWGVRLPFGFQEATGTVVDALNFVGLTRRNDIDAYPLSPKEQAFKDAYGLALYQLINRYKRANPLPFDEAEQLLWYTEGFPAMIDKPEEEEAWELGQRRINRAIRLMHQSRNPYFRQSADFLLTQDPLIKQVVLRDDLPVRSDGNVSDMSVQFTVEDATLQWEIAVSVGTALHQSSFELALAFAHELTHLRSLFTHFATGQDPESWVHDEASFVTEEAKAYTSQARAYLYHVRVIGDRGFYRGTREELLAAYFLQTGAHMQSEQWQAYLQNRHLAYALESRRQGAPLTFQD